MIKADITFPRGTAEFVIQHAHWQRSRGRGPSEPFNGIRNPAAALKAAIEAALFKPKGGLRFSEAEMQNILNFGGEHGSIAEPYEAVAVGGVINLSIDPSPYIDKARSLVLQLSAVAGGFYKSNEVPRTYPSTWLFDATVIGASGAHDEEGTHAMGVIFPDGVCVVVTHTPEYRLPERLLAASLVMPA